jgi:hypothetical protein
VIRNLGEVEGVPRLQEGEEEDSGTVAAAAVAERQHTVGSIGNKQRSSRNHHTQRKGRRHSIGPHTEQHSLRRCHLRGRPGQLDWPRDLEIGGCDCRDGHSHLRIHHGHRHLDNDHRRHGHHGHRGIRHSHAEGGSPYAPRKRS